MLLQAPVRAVRCRSNRAAAECSAISVQSAPGWVSPADLQSQLEAQRAAAVVDLP